jgi:CubicO group peptidase (beta-lactamase class C family)
MKKFLKVFLIVCISLVILALTYAVVVAPPVMGGMVAKTMCSCVFISGRSGESVVQKELQVFPGLARFKTEINREDSSVTARLLWQTSKAIYRRGLGCTLLAEADEADVRKQKINVARRPHPEQDTIPWPSGDVNARAILWNSDTSAIEKIVDEAFAEADPGNPANTHAVVVVYRGKIIAEKYAEEFDAHSMQMGWSMAKSMTNALIGVLVKQGMLTLDAPAPVEEWQSDERSQITLSQLLRASSGLEWNESYFVPSSDFHTMFIRRDDKAAYAAAHKLTHPPGEFFEYSSGTTNILSRIIRRTVGDERYYRFPYDDLFSKIGMYHTLLEPDASGTFITSSCGFASARDWARLGLLFLDDGMWNGERILPEGWVRYSTTPAPAATRREYGAQMWLNLGEEGNPDNCEYPGLPHDAIIFDGFEKNYVVIVPSKQLVVVRLGVTHNRNFSIGNLVGGMLKLLPDDNETPVANAAVDGQ